MLNKAKYWKCSSCKILLLVLFCFQAHAQPYPEDSLLVLAGKAPSDSLRLRYLYFYNKATGERNGEKGFKLQEALKKEAASNNLLYFMSLAAQDQSAIMFRKGDYIRSILYDEESLKYYQAMPQGLIRTKGIAACYTNLGGTYSLLNDWNSAQQYYSQSIDILLPLNDQFALTTSYFNMAFIYIDMQEWPKAKEYLVKSIQSGFQAKVTRELILSLSRCAAICFRVGQKTAGNRYLAQCDSIRNTHQEPVTEIYYYFARGESSYYSGNTEDAIANHRTAYAYSLEYKDPYYIVDESAALGQLYLKSNKKDSALYFLKIAIDSGETYGYLPKLKTILSNWAGYFEQKGDYAAAYRYRTLERQFADSLTVKLDRNRILLYDARYQSRQKEEQISQLQTETAQQQQLLRQKTTINFLLGIMALVLTILGIVGYINFRQKQKIQQQQLTELEKEKQLLTTAALLRGEEKERSRLAKDLHDGLGGMLSGIQHLFRNIKGNIVITPETQQSFDRGLDMLDQSIHEMRRVAHNMMPESLVKFGLDTALRDFCADINSAGSLKVSYQSVGLDVKTLTPTTSITVYRIIQELLNNTLKHAAATHALVQLVLVENQLSITVEDDGKGMDTGTTQSQQGMGWTNIHNRVQFLQGTLDLKSEKDKGVSILIIVPS